MFILSSSHFVDTKSYKRTSHLTSCQMWWGLLVAVASLPDCPATPGPIVIPDGTSEIPDQEYFDCDKLTGVTFNTDGILKTIGSNAFHDTIILTGDILIPASVTKINRSAFENSAITSLAFEANSNLQDIGTLAFSGAESLTGPVIIPNSTTKIDHYAFVSTGITSFEIPESVDFWGMTIFADCTQLSRVIVHGDDDSWQGQSVNNLALSLCLPSNNQPCIEGSGTRAYDVIASPHPYNICGLAQCAPTASPTAYPAYPTAAPEAPEESDDSGPSTGVMVGVIVGGTLGTALVGTLIYNFCVRGGASVGKEVGKVGSLLF